MKRVRFPLRLARTASRLPNVIGLTLAVLTGVDVVGAEPRHGAYVDERGRQVDFDSTYQGWFGPARYEPHHVRAVVENVATSALELGVYWADWGSSVVDWQYPNILSKLESNEAVRLDDNLLQTNYLFHSFAGGFHYLVTRANGLGVLPAFAAAAGSSILYEFVLEWKEIVSINDLIVTPFGGAAMGEFLYQFGNYLNSAPLNHADPMHAGLAGGVRTAFGFMRQAHNAIDDPRAPPSVPLDNLGLSSAYAHAFRLLAIQDSNDHQARGTSTLYGGDLRLELAAMPGFLRAGRFATGFRDGNFTSCAARLSLGGDGTKDAGVRFDSDLFGWYSQDLAPARGGQKGYANEAAVGVGMRYVTRSLHGTEQYGIVHLVRPMERSWIALGPVRLRLSTSISPDFASVRSLAYEPYREEYGSAGSKSSLLRHGYVHTLGFSTENTLAVGTHAFEVGLEGSYGVYESIDGVERVQEEVTRNTHSREVLTELTARFRVEPPGTPFSAMIESHLVRHDSRLDAVSTTQIMRRLTVGMGLRF